MPKRERSPFASASEELSKLLAFGRWTAFAVVVIPNLQRALGSDRVLTAKEDLLTYAFDATAVLNHLPRAVVFPRSAAEISLVLKEARQAGVAVVTRGSGTGLSGGSVPSEGSIVLCTVQMNRILEIDTRNLTLLAECGAITQAIFDAAADKGLFYPPDPGSMKISTIGGNVAENSGGLRGLKYGVTRDYVMGLEVVLADGTICWLGNKCVKDVAGYSLKDLFIGSEGTLGIITQVLLKLLPKPAARQTLLATFGDLEIAADAVSAIIAAPIIPCTLEFLDRTTLQCVEAFAKVGLPTEAEVLLLIETDGHPAASEDDAERIEVILRQYGATSLRRARDAQESAQLALARRSAFSALARVKPTTILEDVTVPRSELAAMVKFIQETALKHRVQVATFGHFGDGNLHPTFLTDERDRDEMHRVELALEDIFKHCLKLRGTITGEHGVGLAKKNALRAQLGEGSYALMKQIKHALDPSALLNPGKIFD